MVARITPPATEPARYGLSSVSDVRTDPSIPTPPTDRWQTEGADWISTRCGQANVWPLDCDDESIPVTVTVRSRPNSEDSRAADIDSFAGIPEGAPERDVIVRAGTLPARRVTAKYGMGFTTKLGTITLDGHEVQVDLTAEPTGDNDPATQAVITGQATLVNGTGPRDVTVAVGSNDPATITTGQDPTSVATVTIPRRTVTCTIQADDAGEVTASATVSGGPARDLTVAVGALDPVTITTGQDPTSLGTVEPGEHDVEVVDDTTNASAAGVLETVDGEASETEVTVQPPYEQSHTVTVTDVDSGASTGGSITVAAGGTGETSETVSAVEESSLQVSIRDVTTGATNRGTLRIDAEREGETQIRLQLPAGDAKTIDPGRLVNSTGAPFGVYAGVDLSHLGAGDVCTQITMDQAADTARSLLQVSEWRTVEERYWLDQLAPDADDLTPGGDDLPSIQDAAAILEQAIADRYGAVGVIHSARHAWPYARGLVGRDTLTDPDESLPDVQLLRTELWTRWAFGFGYPGTGPDGSDPEPGTTWLYATGAVLVRRSPIIVPATPSTGAFDPATNKSRVLAERLYTVGHECFTVAVHTRLTNIPITEGAAG